MENVDGKYGKLFESYCSGQMTAILMTGTNAPRRLIKIPRFWKAFGDAQRVFIGHNGEEHTVKIRASICKPDGKTGGGDKELIGHMQLGTRGVSVVRSARELEMNHSFH